MSFDLFVWWRPVPASAEEADNWLSGEDENAPDFEPHPVLRAFREALLAEHPALEDPRCGEDSPWAMTPTDDDALVGIFLRWGAAPSVAPRVIELAARFGLVIFDPQGPDVHA